MAMPPHGTLPDSRLRILSADSLAAIAVREKTSDRYWTRPDPICSLRLGWRAQPVRHMFHLLPHETILELGCGSGQFTRALLASSRNECPVTAATFCYP